MSGVAKLPCMSTRLLGPRLMLETAAPKNAFCVQASSHVAGSLTGVCHGTQAGMASPSGDIVVGAMAGQCTARCPSGLRHAS
eukprot:3121982-Prorocentrum_lima.AAC.1